MRPPTYRLFTIVAAFLLLAGGFVGALDSPGVVGLVGYGVSAVAAATVGRVLHVATRRDRGHRWAHATSLIAGLFALVAVADALTIVVAVMLGQPAGNVDLRLGVLLVTVLLALLIGTMGMVGPARGRRSREHIPPATPEHRRSSLARSGQRDS